MVRTKQAADDRMLDPQDPESIASGIVAAQEDDSVTVVATKPTSDAVSIYTGSVVSTGYHDPNDSPGGTHIVTIKAGSAIIAVLFKRTIETHDDYPPTPAMAGPVVFGGHDSASVADVRRFDRGKHDE